MIGLASNSWLHPDRTSVRTADQSPPSASVSCSACSSGASGACCGARVEANAPLLRAVQAKRDHRQMQGPNGAQGRCAGQQQRPSMHRSVSLCYGSMRGGDVCVSCDIAANRARHTPMHIGRWRARDDVARIGDPSTTFREGDGLDARSRDEHSIQGARRAASRGPSAAVTTSAHRRASRLRCPGLVLPDRSRRRAIGQATRPRAISREAEVFDGRQAAMCAANRSLGVWRCAAAPPPPRPHTPGSLTTQNRFPSGSTSTT